MKKLNQWIKAHPYKAIIFVFLFTLIAACLAVINEQAFWRGTVFGAGVIVFWALIFSRDALKLPAILALAIAVPSTKAAEPPREVSPGVAVGVVVICVGGYCVYKVVKFCQKKFPKDTNTNSPPSFSVNGGDESAASWSYGAIGTCDPTLTPEPEFVTSDTSSGTLFTLDIRLDQDGDFTVRMSASGESATQGWAEFQTEVARHGVYVTGSADGSQYFSTNRVPCRASDIPISFDALTKTIELRSDNPMKLIEVERSRDLQNWSSFLRTKVSAGAPDLRIQDATTAVSMFYRVNVSSL